MKEFDDTAATLDEVRDFSRMFISYMNHELRGAVNIIMGYATMVLDEWSGPLNEEQRQNMQQVTEGANRIMGQVEDLLAACRTVIIPADTVMTSFDLKELVEEVAGLYRPAAETKNLQLIVSGSSLQAFTDRNQLGAALRQVIDNAVRFTETGTVTVEWEGGEGAVVVRVADTGVGMSMEETEKVFKRFVRFSYAIRNRIPGTGIGLFIVGRIVRDRLHGSIDLESSPGSGTTISITLPAGRDRESA